MALPPSLLIVDDYPDALDVWGLYLRAEGFNVLTAADGQSAFAEAVRQKPDVIVMDLELPESPGSRWRANSRRARTRARFL